MAAGAGKSAVPDPLVLDQPLRKLHPVCRAEAAAGRQPPLHGGRRAPICPRSKLDAGDRQQCGGRPPGKAGPHLIALRCSRGGQRSQVIRLKNSTIVGLGSLATWEGDSAKDILPVQFEAAGNVFNLARAMLPSPTGPTRNCGRMCNGRARATFTPRPHSGLPPAVSGPADRQPPPAVGLAAWSKFWDSPETGSKEAGDVCFGYNEIRRLGPEAAMAAARRTTTELRRETSAGLGSGWSRGGLRAGVGRRGQVGAAGAVAAQGARRRAAGNRASGKIVQGYLDLQQAANAAQSGDTIEIRSDGPLAGCRIKQGKQGTVKSLAVRSAPGYRPVVEGGVVFSSGADFT